MNLCLSLHRKPATLPGSIRRLATRIGVLALALVAILALVDGQRWLSQRASARSAEYAAATCAVDTIIGESRFSAADDCAAPERATGAKR